MLAPAANLLRTLRAGDGPPLGHPRGLAVIRARRGRRDRRGGERKSAPKEAAAKAEPVRSRPDLRAVASPDPLDAAIRPPAARRRERVAVQARRATRRRDPPSGLFPALERRHDPMTGIGLVPLGPCTAPERIRAAGAKRIVRRPTTAASGLRSLAAPSEDAMRMAKARIVAIPRARLRPEIARKACNRRRIADPAMRAPHARHPDEALIQSLPGTGATFRAAFIARVGGFDGAEAPVAAAPILRRSGKTRFPRRAAGGDRAVRRVGRQAASTAPGRRVFDDRRPAEGEPLPQAGIALARRRLNGVRAGTHRRRTFRENLDLGA